jgi:PAS domain S-box-containing protein
MSESGKTVIAGIRFDHLFEFCPDAILATDTAGMIRDANPAAAALFGYTVDELIGMSVEALIPEQFRDSHLRHREYYNADPREREMGTPLNLFALRKNLTEFPVDIMLKPMHTPEGSLTICFVRDMTEQKAAMETVRTQDQQLRTIIEGLRGFAIYHVDRDGNVMTWNTGAERIFGYAADEIIATPFSRLFSQEERERDRPTELMRLALQKGSIDHQGWRQRKDGSRFWADIVVTTIRDAGGEVVRFAAVSRDTTDRKLAEEALMLELSTSVLMNLDVYKLADAVAESIRNMIPHDTATIAVRDPATNGLVVHFLRSDENKSSRDGIRVPLERSPDGQVFRTGEPLVLKRIDESPFDDRWIRHLTAMGMQSGCWVPLIYRGDPVGVLAVAGRTTSAFGQHKVEMLEKIAEQVALVAVSAREFRRVADMRDRLVEENRYLEEQINLESHFEEIIGESTSLREVLKLIEIVAPTDATVLIEGETGTGKELLARAIHRLSPRNDRTFIKLNCAAIPANLLESELFGHEKGAFTGAISRKMGRLELANNGTLFLDEVGEMPLELQPKLLRALQEREVERLGGTRPIAVNVRLIAATNRDLAKMVAEKQFRADLFYRLKVFPINAPSLRNRTTDIPLLVRHFVDTHSRKMRKSIPTIPDETMKALMRWEWPGNIRELGNLMERSVILTRGSVLYVPITELRNADDSPESGERRSGIPGQRAIERERILRALRETKGRISGASGAAARLGIKRTTLNSKLKTLGIERRDYA